jgi:L-glyceraldehyde 3-phosphate reductase
MLRELGTPCLIHQPSYSMLNRWIEADALLDTLEREGIGCIAFSPLAQGMLTGKYLQGIPEDSRAKAGKSLRENFIREETIERIRALNEIAKDRGQSLAQMAIAWVLRDKRVTSALIGASRVEQITELAGALQNLSFAPQELDDIERHAQESGINLWAQSSAA